MYSGCAPDRQGQQAAIFIKRASFALLIKEAQARRGLQETRS